MKKIFTLIFAFVLCLGLASPIFADEGFVDEYCRVADSAELLSESEYASLIETLDEISIRQKMDIIVATANDMSGYTTQEYADTLYEQCSFGYGANRDGLLLLINMQDSDWYISTTGYGITAFTNDGIQYIGKQIKGDLSAGNYAAAFTKYAELCDEFITQARNGEPFDSKNLPREPLSLIWIPISIIIGFVIAKIIVGNMKGKLKTVHAQAAANDYVKKGSMSITESRDLYLYHTVTKSVKSNNASSGSSTHTSSSGTTHGGGGGKF